MVFWNVSELERQNVLSFLKPFETGSYDQKIVHEENEHMIYTYTEVLYVDKVLSSESRITIHIISF